VPCAWQKSSPLSNHGARGGVVSATTKHPLEARFPQCGCAGCGRGTCPFYQKELHAQEKRMAHSSLTRTTSQVSGADEPSSTTFCIIEMIF
jgi:hypothetical protein